MKPSSKIGSERAIEMMKEPKLLLEKIVKDSMTGPNVLDDTHPTHLMGNLLHENGRVGGLFASKAFVQLFVNPLVGKATQHFGYEIPFMLGSGLLFVSSLGKGAQNQEVAFIN